MRSKLEQNLKIQADADEVPTRSSCDRVEIHENKWPLAFFVILSIQSVAQGATSRLESILITMDGKPKARLSWAKGIKMPMPLRQRRCRGTACSLGS